MSTPEESIAAPSRGALLKSTVLALCVAAVLLVTCVLPAEYGVDLTGAGRVLGLTQMGEVKQALVEEEVANAAAQAAADSAAAASEAEAESSGSGAETAPGGDTALTRDSTTKP